MNAYIQSLLGFGGANAPVVHPVRQSLFEGAQATELVEIFEESVAEPAAGQPAPSPDPATGIQPVTDSWPDHVQAATPDLVSGEPRGDRAVPERESRDPGSGSVDAPRQSVTVKLAREATEDIGDERPSRRVDVQPTNVAVPASPAQNVTISEVAYPEVRTEELPVQSEPPATAGEGTQDISITIGRVIVTAPRESAPARKPKRRPVGVTTLDEYLGHRRKDERR